MIQGGLYVVQSRGGAPVALCANACSGEFYTLVSDDVPAFRREEFHNGLKLESDYVATDNTGTITILGHIGTLLAGIPIEKRSERVIAELLRANACHAASDVERAFYSGVLNGVQEGTVAIEPGYVRLPQLSKV